MIELRENTPRTCALTREDLTYLLSLVKRSPEEGDDTRVLQSITPTSKPGEWQLIAGLYVGRLGLPSGNWIDFRSRFDFSDVIRLIQLSSWPPAVVKSEAVPASSGHLLVDALAAAFAREVGRLVGQGLSKSYRQHRQMKPPYGGRIDVAFHMSRFAGRQDVLVTQKRRLTVDIAVNRALAAALEVLHRVPLRADARRPLSRLRPAFARVEVGMMRASDVRGIQLRGETLRYRNALILSEAILRSQDLIPVGSGAPGASILFFMPDVWEKYVARWVSETANPGDLVEAPYSFRLTKEGRTAEADVVVKSSGRIRQIFDAKYKSPERAPGSQDIYQMVTYCEALGLTEATLVYPGEVAGRSVTVKGKTVRTRGLSLDLSDVEAALSVA